MGKRGAGDEQNNYCPENVRTPAYKSIEIETLFAQLLKEHDKEPKCELQNLGSLRATTPANRSNCDCAD